MDTTKPEHRGGPEPIATEAADSAGWAKRATIGISALALIATCASASAAWASWRTARASENVARSSLDTANQALMLSGARPEVLADVALSGRCAADDGLKLEVTVRNSGHLATTLNRLDVGLDYSNTLSNADGSGGAEGSWEPVSIAFSKDLDVAIPAQDQARVSLPVDCQRIATIVGGGSEAPALASLVDGKTLTVSADDARKSVRGDLYLAASYGTGTGTSLKVRTVTAS